MSQTRYLLTIDLGGSGPKVALVSEHGDVVAATRGHTPIHFLANGGVEQDPADWWNSIRDAARSLLAQRLVPVDDIIAVGCASQWSVIVPVDESGAALMNAVHWMDARGGAFTTRLMDGWIKVSGYEVRKLARWLRLTGAVPTHTGADSLSHILFIKHDRPDVYRRTFKFLEPMDYLGMRLTGRFAASHASIFPYFLTDNRQVAKIEYADSLIRLSGVDRSKLPDLLPVDAVLGPILPAVADDWGLSHKTQVMIGSGDSQVAVMGSGAVAPFDVHLCVGTSSWVTCHIPFRKVDLLNNLATMPSAASGQFMVLAEQGAAGKCLEFFAENWFTPAGASDNHVGELLEAASQAPPGSDGILFLPWLNGSGPPPNDGKMRGGFLNLSLKADRPVAVRSVLEGVSCNLRWITHAVERFIGRPIPSLHYIGGGARTALWCQIMADVFNRQIHQVADPHFAIVRGVAFNALIGLKRMKLEDIPGKVKIQDVYDPNPDLRQMYDDKYKEFLRAYRATRPFSHRWAARSR